jgi:hypothetical protein
MSYQQQNENNTNVDKQSDILTIHTINIRQKHQPFIKNAVATFTLNKNMNRVYCCVFVKKGLYKVRVGGTNWVNNNNDHVIRFRIKNNIKSPFKKSILRKVNSTSILLDRINCNNNVIIYKPKHFVCFAATPEPIDITPEPIITTPLSMMEINSPPPVIQHRYRQKRILHNRNDIINFMDYLIHHRYSSECISITYEESIKNVWSYLVRNEGLVFTRRWFYNNRIPTRNMRHTMRK